MLWSSVVVVFRCSRNDLLHYY